MPPVVLVTAHGDVPMCVRAMRQGAFHVLEKPFVPGELVSIVKSAVHRTLVRRAQQGIPADLEARLASLDAEEQQILELVLAGKVNKQIAHLLNKGERTIQFRVSSLLSKLGMPTRKRLVSTLSNVRPSSYRALTNATADI
jgi:FixJ family two-component response regulator